MKKFIILFVGLILCSLLKVNAQVTFAPKVGVNFANLGGDLTDNQIRLRTQFGTILNVGVNEMFSFQPGLLLSGKGTTLDYGDGDKDAITLTYLEIPLNGILNIDLGTGKLQLFAGPYLGFCLDAKYKYLSDEDNETESIDVGASDDDEIKPTDFGINVGVGFVFGDFQVQGGYGSSFTSISNYEDDKLTNSVISLSFAYFINLNK
jgi:hypothetical protein